MCIYVNIEILVLRNLSYRNTPICVQRQTHTHTNTHSRTGSLQYYLLQQQNEDSKSP